MEARLQAQVRALSREVGSLKEDLSKEGKRRERLAVRAKECEELQLAAEAKAKSLTYVNLKLEQELASLKEKVQCSGAKNKSSLETLRDRLVGVEKSVEARAVEAQRQLQRVRGMVQELAAATMPLAVVAAASRPAQQRTASLHGRGQPMRPAQQPAPRPTELHNRFSQVLAGLSQLSESITGHSLLSDDDARSSKTTAAPLLLKAPDGSTKSVHWKEGDPPAAQQQGSALPAFDAEKEHLRAQVQQLQAELSNARSSKGSGSSKVQAAVQQLEAVVPQYRAAATALQRQVTVLKGKLAEVCQERGQLQEEAGHWQHRVQQLEAAYGEITAKVHAKEAQALAMSSQAQSHTERLSCDVEALRQRCTDLGVRLRGAQQDIAKLQAAVAEKNKLISAQQGTIRQLESTISDQQEDIHSALDLVTNRTGAAAAAAHDALLPHHSSDWDDVGLHSSPHACGPSAAALSGAAGSSSWGVGGPAFDPELLAEPLSGAAAFDTWSIPATASGAGGGADSGAFGAVSISPRGHHHSPAVSSLAQQQHQQEHRQGWESPGQGKPRPKSGSSRGVDSIEAEIAGLEDALRRALTDLNV